MTLSIFSYEDSRMKRVVINETADWSAERSKSRNFRDQETLEIRVGENRYRVEDGGTGLAANIETGEIVVLEMEEVSPLIYP